MYESGEIQMSDFPFLGEANTDEEPISPWQSSWETGKLVTWHWIRCCAFNAVRYLLPP